MYLEKNVKNKLTIGKHLRKLKQLRKTDKTASLLPPSPQLTAYKEELIKSGLIIGPLDVALFQTRNGLTYPGFIARSKIVPNSVLLRVPVDCLLTTRDAFLSDIQKVFMENPRFYSRTFSSDWQDRILLTYLLYEYQKGQKSRWFYLLQNLPKQIDYVALWPQNELSLLQDGWVSDSIRRQRSKIDKQQQEIISIILRYPQYFRPQIFTSQNIRWIHVHLVTRCFGKYFEYTTMVPYAQLFNHECVDVYYTMGYKEDNPHNPKEELAEPKEITESEEEEADTSDGSYEASDVSCQHEDFEERELAIDLKDFLPSLTAEYNSHHSYILSFINFNDEVSLPFLEKVYAEMQAVLSQSQLQALQRFKRVHPKLVKYLKLVKQFYYQLGSNRYAYGLKQRKIWRQKQKKQQQAQVDPNVNYFQSAWPKDKFDQFQMVCGSKDQFEQNSQVYFCYGRLPNRLLLMRYGIALEHNKYDHLFLRVDVSEFVYKNGHLQRAVQMDVALRRFRRFKLKRARFCVELLTFNRAMLWDYSEQPDSIFYVLDLQREIQALKMMRAQLQDKLSSFSCTLQQNEERLLSKALGYHEYFAVVYRLEQQRIVVEQMKMAEYARELVQVVRKGASLEALLRGQQKNERLSWQIMMEAYLKTFRQV